MMFIYCISMKKSEGISDTGFYIRSITKNAKKFEGFLLSLKDVLEASELVFQISDKAR